MLKTAVIFSDGMVLQRDKSVAVWGAAAPCSQVSVTIQGKTANTISDEKGEWSVQCGPFHTSFREEMTVQSGNEELRIKDVAVGEVWLAGGQSNMEFPMKYDKDLEAEKKECDKRIRFFDYPEVAYPEQLAEADYFQHYAIWRTCTQDQLEYFSAVAYYFAKYLLNDYDIPVGIIGCNWGGTAACAWMPEEAIRKSGGSIWLEDYEMVLEALDMQGYATSFKQDPYNYKVDLLADPMFDILVTGYQSDVIVQKVKEIGMEYALNPTMGPYSERRPTGLYHSMLKQIAPYGISGVLWYQGEADEEKSGIYHRMFAGLIQCWRELWNDELPFLFVQIAPFGHWLACRGNRYPEIRAAQQWVADNVSNTAMAVITDAGSEWDIHPKNKEPVGKRLALLAKHYVYGEKDIVCEAPRMQKAVVDDGRIVLHFEHIGSGLVLCGEQVNALEIYQGGYPVPYETCSVGKDTVTLHGRQICRNMPTEVRMAWTDYYDVNLKNSAGIPARPAIVKGECVQP